MLRLLLFLIPVSVFAQTESLKWYFGYQAGLDFSKGKPYVIQGLTGTTHRTWFARRHGGLTIEVFGENEPSVVLSDTSGNVVFYSDGVAIWDKKQREVTYELSANASHSQMVALEIPDAANEYLIIYPYGDGNSVNGWNFSKLKMNAKGRLEVLQLNQAFVKGTFLQSAVIVPNSNGKDYWLLLHGIQDSANNECYFSFPVTKEGIGKPVLSPALYYVSPGYPISNMAVNSSFDRVACSFYGAENGGVEIMEFNNSNGVMANRISFINHLEDPSQAYGVAFSPKGKYLYITECENEVLSQFSLKTEDNQAINDSRKIIDRGTETRARLGQIQKGPDGKLYIPQDVEGEAYDMGCNFIGVINFPDTIISRIKWNREEIDVPVTYRLALGLGLPSLTVYHKRKETIAQKDSIVKVLKDTIPVNDLSDAVFLKDTFQIEGLVFATNTYELSAESKEALQDLVVYMMNHLDVQVKIYGHTDNVGDEKSNLILSANRANAVKAYLISKSIEENRIKAKGFGSSHPKYSNDSDAGRALNRRVEFIFEKKKKK
jgi:outer membrane protein OmpA-like peptidoglycan-associated protein